MAKLYTIVIKISSFFENCYLTISYYRTVFRRLCFSKPFGYTWKPEISQKMEHFYAKT